MMFPMDWKAGSSQAKSALVQPTVQFIECIRDFSLLFYLIVKLNE